MPELPDVEVFRRRLAAGGLHRRVDRVEVLDTALLRRVSERRLTRELRGAELGPTRRHGKHLFAAVSAGGHLVLHFGMTGYLAIGAGESEPSQTRLVLHLDGDRRINLVDQRRLGFVTLAADVDDYIATEGLGPDALNMNVRTLRDLLAGRRGAVKPALMDQALVAGIGNIYSDEILFQARVHPRSPAAALDEPVVARLHRHTQRVLRMAADRGADVDRMPRTWLLPRRTDGAACPRGNGTVRRMSISGRGAYYCTGCQPEPSGLTTGERTARGTGRTTSTR